MAKVEGLRISDHVIFQTHIFRSDVTQGLSQCQGHWSAVLEVKSVLLQDWEIAWWLFSVLA